MPIFDYYVMVDWSGGGRRRGNRQDAIWIAHGARVASPQTESPYSRTEAARRILEIITANLDDGRRVLVCCDFAYGFPKGFSPGLPIASGSAWKMVWSYLHATLQDDLGTRQGRLPSNRNNRFDVAEAINILLSPTSGLNGPFWCLPKTGTYPHIPQNQPGQPFTTAQGHVLEALRETDRRAHSNTPFRLFGTGSVGSQVLTGIPRLYTLRSDPSLANKSAVWPFETGWATNASWIDPDIQVVHAEIYPSVKAPLPDEIKDRGQVRSMWEWARDLDRHGLFWSEFSIPAGIQAGSADDICIRAEEGWILGVGNAPASMQPSSGIPLRTNRSHGVTV